MTEQIMQAIRVYQYGGPEQLKLEDIPRPEPGLGEVLIRIHTAGVLPAEWKMRQGFFQTIFPASFPYIPGSAMAGVIEEVGPGVVSFQKGQAVFGRSTHGAYAEYTTTEVEPPALKPNTFSLLALKPKELSFAEAATLSGGATIAWTGLFGDGQLQKGQSVLIHGAAGGVGLFAVQFARWKGANVIATTSTANVNFVRALGAETVIDYTKTPFEQVVHNVDLVLDTIGGETLERSMHVLKAGGTLISLLEQPDQEKALALGISARKNSFAPTSEHLRSIANLIAEEKVKPVVGKLFPLHEAQQAHILSQSGHGRGRIVLQITA
ncbi:NADP-dependent oxidoreductase [Ktedonosporobacter rubrisoli]|uniref:NADP-dependent oxidoreductase n=1 Tax=Ktedonosporobacter rubrisoli TaxID=2509675 RepID=A0A4V0YYM6_KTERU|nr:NADP-dependent oxidoreductase [Ktedonosporobacter rubrisoli]QBD76751.1 NADP-dependent oxidoreductase [Ktedonosporobacter rubrisoli]